MKKKKRIPYIQLLEVSKELKKGNKNGKRKVKQNNPRGC